MRAQLTQQLQAHEADHRRAVVVVTLPDLQGGSIEDFGYQLGRHWGIGQKGKDNGALLIVARDERKLRIEVGYGLEERLTDAQSLGDHQSGDHPGIQERRFRPGHQQGWPP